MCQEKQKINNIPTLVERLVRESEIVNTKQGNLIMTRVLKVSSTENAHWDPNLCWQSGKASLGK